MTFFAPYMLWGAVAAGIPIALHFFYRSRYRTVPWAAMQFLLTSIEQTSRRLRFQELLLLILRVAILLLLAFALARPTTSAAGRGQGDAVDAVFIVDQSLSMGARAGVAPAGASNDPYLAALKDFAAKDGSVTAFDRARAAALAVLQGLPAHSTVQIIGCSDRATLLGPHTPSQLDQARKLIQEMPLTSLGTDLAPALAEAQKALERGPSPNKEIYLFSDMQQDGWDRRGTKVKELLGDLRREASITLVHCSTQPIGNIAITSITPQTTLRSGERADFAVLVRNTGAKLVKNVSVKLLVDGQIKPGDSQPLTEIRPGQTRAVVLTGYIEKAGRHVITATVNNDDLPGDNRLDQVINVQDQVGILIVDGAPNPSDPKRAASFYLAHALESATTGTLPVTIRPADRAAPRDLVGKEICILVNAGVKGTKDGVQLSEDFQRSLGAFVREGHGLMIFPGDRVTPATYNEAFGTLLPFRLAKLAQAPKDRPWTIDRKSADRAPFDRFRSEEGYAGIDKIEAERRLELELPKSKAANPEDESRILLAYQGGQPAIVSRHQAGQGEVMFFTTAVHDPAWSNWFIAPAFVPFVEVALNHLLRSQPRELNRTAGETLVWPTPRDQASTTFDLVLPDGTRRRLGKPSAVAGRFILTAGDIAQGGLYRIAAVDAVTPMSEEQLPVFAVGPDLGETENLEILKPDQIDSRLDFTARHVTAGDEGAVFSGAERLRSEWTPWLLVGLLVLVLGEMALAWFCGRSL